uniref:Uncharacterized protein n=1 Tax=Lygus hesperus TaxID=30085 RepID=A0A0K8SR07_LYGHE
MCTRLLAVLAVALSFDACLLHINAVPNDEDEALKVFLSTLNHEEKQLLEKASRKNGQRSLGKDFGTEFKDFLAALVPPKGQLNLAMDYDIKATKGLPPKKDK